MWRSVVGRAAVQLCVIMNVALVGNFLVASGFLQKPQNQNQCELFHCEHDFVRFAISYIFRASDASGKLYFRSVAR